MRGRWPTFCGAISREASQENGWTCQWESGSSVSAEFQGRPLVLQALTLDLPDLAFAYAETLNHQLSGTGNVRPVVLGMNKSEEDFLAAIFGKFLVVWLLCHGIPLS